MKLLLFYRTEKNHFPSRKKQTFLQKYERAETVQEFFKNPKFQNFPEHP